MTTQPPDQPQWAWAQPQPTRIVDTEPLDYHRLLRGIPRYRWWKPLLILLLAAGFAAVVVVAISVLWGFIIAAQQPDLISANNPQALTDALVEATRLDTQNPLSILLNLLVLALLIPCVLLAMRIVGGPGTAGRIWSVATRIRWGLLGRSLGWALLAVFVMNVVGIACEIALDPGSLTAGAAADPPQIDWSAALLSLAFVVVLVPFQAAAEEVVFRGLFMQVLGSWLRSPWFGILLPSVLFALGHIYNLWGLVAVGLMGLAAAWLTWRTGGLEAAIAIHVINNLIAFGFLSFGVGGETAQTEDAGGLGSVIGEAVGLALFVWLVMRSFRKHRYGRQRIDRIEVAMPLGSLDIPVGPPAYPPVERPASEEPPRA